MSKTTPLISIIIPCLNEAGTVEQLLRQLVATKSEMVEIIAVDNRSSDTTLKVLSSFKQLGVKVVSDIPEGVSRARNAGAAIAQGKWLVFLDADTLLPPNFLIELITLLSSKPKFELAALAYRAQSTNIFFKFLVSFAQSYQRLSFYISRKPLIPGAVCLVKRTIHEAIGGFNENIRYNEDFDYSKRAYLQAPYFKSLYRPHVYFSVRRLEHGGWHKVIATYVRAELARMRGKKYDPKQYDMSDHTMK